MNACDTFNFVLQKLAGFLKAIGLNNVEVKKRDFPNYHNLPVSWDKIILFPNPSQYIIQEKVAKNKKTLLH